MLASDRRAASKAIVENKGLAPHKPRKNRNPRVKKKVERRMGDGGGMSGYSSLGY